MKHRVKALIVAGIAASLAACSGQQSPASHHHTSHATPSPGTAASSGSCGAEPHPHRYFGVIVDYPGSPAYRKFLRQTKVKPTLDDFFYDFGTRWKPAGACYAIRHGALPLLQFNLRRISATKIASGSADKYITHLAGQIAAFGSPLVISLGHEMNGNWYPWGWPRTKAATFVRAWRRVHDIFAAQKATHVIWMWTVNRAVAPAVRPQPWWPGPKYVDWVGIDGHDRHPTDSFAKVFGSTIADVRQLTNDPILISEDAVVAGPRRPAQLANLYQTVYSTPGLLGILYLDMRTVRIDWRLDDPASIRAFTNAVQPYEASAHG